MTSSSLLALLLSCSTISHLSTVFSSLSLGWCIFNLLFPQNRPAVNRSLKLGVLPFSCLSAENLFKSIFRFERSIIRFFGKDFCKDTSICMLLVFLSYPLPFCTTEVWHRVHPLILFCLFRRVVVTADVVMVLKTQTLSTETWGNRGGHPVGCVFSL